MMDNPLAWEIFSSCFSIGDEVVVVDEWDQVIVGKLVSVSEESCTVKSVFSQRERKIDWNDVVFFSHDGFPVQKMQFLGADELFELDTKSTQEAIRKVLTHSYDSAKGKWVLADGTQPKRRVEQIVRGDPFLIENVTASIYHPGNCGPGFWCADHEETVVLEADDGAKANMYNLPTVFHMGFSPGQPLEMGTIGAA